jgi:hypothetical protein
VVAEIRVVVSAHWVNAGFVRPLARPYVCIDGVEHVARWSAPLVLATTPGEHEVSTFMRYRGTSIPLGRGTVTVTAADGATTDVRARNGWANHMPFTPVVEA